MKLILFFNGWGMDKSFISQIKIPKNFVVEIIDFPYIYNVKNIDEYETVYFIGWSFGAWYLTRFIIKNGIKSKNIIALNGSSKIIGEYGISYKMLDYTIKNLTEKSLLKFYKNMGLINKNISQRKFSYIKEELIYFRKNYIPLKNVFQKIIIGNKDRIVPFKNQKKHCVEENIKYIEKDFSHYPFEFFKNWNEIIGEENELL